MKRRLLTFLPLISGFYVFSLVQIVVACSCSGIATPFEAYRESVSVFIGKVVNVTDENGKEVVAKKLSEYGTNETWERVEGNRFYRFAVQESFKGAKVSEVKVGLNLNMCQYGFDVGETFLVYAYQSDKTLWTSTFCYRTKRVENAQDDIFFLRWIPAKETEPRVYGSVKLNNKDFTTDYFLTSYLKGIKVIAENGKKKFETFTDKNGVYWFKNIPNGNYKVYLQLPKQYQDRWKTLYEIKLTKNSEPIYQPWGQRTGRASYNDFEVYWNNKISGKVLDAEGKKLERASINLIPINQINSNAMLGKSNIADKLNGENNYVKSGWTPGKYVLSVEVFAPFISQTERLFMYYPQTLTSDKAEVIELGEIDKKNIDIKLPEGFVVREIEGTMYWDGGFPNNDGYVSLEKLENSNDSNNVVYDSQWVKDGKFKLQVFENAEYWLHAKAMQETAKPIKIKVGKSNIPIKIVLPEK